MAGVAVAQDPTGIIVPKPEVCWDPDPSTHKTANPLGSTKKHTRSQVIPDDACLLSKVSIVRCTVGDSVGTSVGESIGDSVGDSVGESAGDAVGNSAGAYVGDSIAATQSAHALVIIIISSSTSTENCCKLTECWSGGSICRQHLSPQFP